MKSFIAITALIGLAAAQTLSQLPQCGQVCINNMLAAATALGCPPKNGQPDALCLCANVDFANGIRDCVIQSCPAGTNTSEIIAFGVAYCDAAAASASAAAKSASPIATSTEYSTITSDGKTTTKPVGTTTIFAAAGEHLTAVTTKPIVSTESDGSKTTIGSTIIYSTVTAAASASSAASSKSESAKSAASSASASASSVAASASSAASSVVASASSAASASASSTTSQAGVAPMATVAAQAFAGIAGLAAVLAL